MAAMSQVVFKNCHFRHFHNNMQHQFMLYITPGTFLLATITLSIGRDKVKVKDKVNSLEILKIEKQIQMKQEKHENWYAVP